MTNQATILIVDDQPELLMGIQMALEAAGYTVITAQDGHLALERLQRDTIDLILADIAMPEMNGYQLFERVRATPRLLRIPFVFLTARAMASDIRYGKSLGVDDYLTKPIKPEDLLAVVEGRLRRARELNEGPLVVAVAEPVSSGREAITDLIEVGTLRISPGQHRVWLRDTEITLSAREFRVLEYLARRAGQVVPPHEIVQMSHALNTDDAEASSLLRPIVRLLRRRLGYATGEMGCIENVRGVGYRLVEPE
ncbi:two component transcriptional regulator, winged helix family [Oscillochloris trichoides DG-6]|uniref:Two component transcriptional regulator, winged helix family n=1 Tax=Oscillochloris trichoides DG-6 TaxID=765420 RepID=E1ID28_9CHLR|nr:response regulator transcription factor [Oscillochloris trichoides]EFO80899.1 two component transcriptional regulator, winged helix family [Oscillochloris trichoides DG-6]